MPQTNKKYPKSGEALPLFGKVAGTWEPLGAGF